MSRFYRKIGSWLGLLAILMATLAPTISHTLAARDAAAGGMPEHCMMASMPMDSMKPMHAMASLHDMSSMQSNLSAQATASTPTDPTGKTTQHTSMSDGDACGYCSLLAHMPAVASVETLFTVAVRARQHIVATRFESVRRVEPLTFAQPRAPPFNA
ncbi:DUF2946 domain-containing protein [Paraburkholderia bryophila]|uniref:DUF2946 domain-containing protein n=1 Tax=Paraburkholderia bryophila TaxID=420952 RepID=UPI003AF16F2F